MNLSDALLQNLICNLMIFLLVYFSYFAKVFWFSLHKFSFIALLMFDATKIISKTQSTSRSGIPELLAAIAVYLLIQEVNSSETRHQRDVSITIITFRWLSFTSLIYFYFQRYCIFYFRSKSLLSNQILKKCGILSAPPRLSR